MQKLSLDPLYITDDLASLRSSLQLQLNKLQDYVNLLQERATPTGAIVGLETATAPVGHLLCNGGTFDANLYPDLYAYLGNSNVLPDYRGRVLVGRDAGQVEFDALGETGGHKGIPHHDHADDGHTHFHSHSISVSGTGAVSSGGQSDNHSHQVAVAGNASASDVQGWSAWNVHNAFRSSDHGGGALMYAGVLGGVCRLDDNSVYQNHTHRYDHGHSAGSVSDGTVGNSDIQPAGDISSTNNLPPYRVVNWFIKT